MTKIVRRTTPAFRAINRAGPTLAAIQARWPTTRELGADYHWLLGSDNAGDLCQITGKRLHPNLRAYVADGGANYTVAPTLAFPNGAVGNVLLSGSSALNPTKISGGSGYTSVPAVSVSATLAPGGRLPRYTAFLTAGAVDQLAINDAGFGLLTDPVLTITGGGGTGANWTAALSKSVKVINVTAGGSGYTAPPAVAISAGGAQVPARAIAIVSAGAVTQVLLLDGGLRYTSVPTVTFSGGGGTGAAATAVLGTNTIRAVELTDCGSQVGSIVATLTGGDGTGGSAGALMATATYTRSPGFLSIPAGGTTDTNAQNGLLLPLLDTAEFTLVAVVKKTTAGSNQVVMGTANEQGSSAGGFDIKNVIGTGYRLQDFNVQLTTTTVTTPGVAGDWIVLVYAITPVAGESVAPSSVPVQSHRLYARAGSQTAISVATGARIALSKRRLIGIGNTNQVGVGFRGALDVAEVIAFKRFLSPTEIDAVISRMVSRQAARGNTVVT